MINASTSNPLIITSPPPLPSQAEVMVIKRVEVSKVTRNVHVNSVSNRLRVVKSLSSVQLSLTESENYGVPLISYLIVYVPEG